MLTIFLTIIRNWFGIRQVENLDSVAFYEDGWKAVTDRAFRAAELAFGAASQRMTLSQSYAECPMLYDLDEGTYKELLQFIFTPEHVRRKYWKRSWSKDCALRRAHLHKSSDGRVFALIVVTPPRR